MTLFRKSNARLLALLLIPALACGPIGCGMEAAIPLVIEVAVAAGFVAFTIHEFQKVDSAHLDNEMKRLRLQGMRNGLPVVVDRGLTYDEYRKIRDSGKVEVNGEMVPVSLRD